LYIWTKQSMNFPITQSIIGVVVATLPHLMLSYSGRLWFALQYGARASAVKAHTLSDHSRDLAVQRWLTKDASLLLASILLSKSLATNLGWWGINLHILQWDINLHALFFWKNKSIHFPTWELLVRHSPLRLTSCYAYSIASYSRHFYTGCSNHNPHLFLSWDALFLK
jgi:hypothetical protein